MLSIEGLTKRYGDNLAVAGLTVEAREGEFFTLLGPSGCGKTTTLRCIGGLEKPDEGSIALGGRYLVSASPRVFVPPERRNMGMVFQSYALWPHMTVFENVAYPLKLRRMGRDEIRNRVRDVLRLVGLEGLEERPAPQLSGGQQQRVALARALVFSPQVLLLDEPLSNLDALLRDEMRQQLKGLQREIGVTTIYVTHDQVEALSLSDRIAIMNRGRLEQVGPPEETYNRPATRFALGFLGRTFTVEGSVAALADGVAQVRVGGGDDSSLLQACVVSRDRETGEIRAGSEVAVAIRPEQIRVWPAPPDGCPNVLPALVRSALFVGDRLEYEVEVGGMTRVISVPSTQPRRLGETIYLELPSAAVTVWPR